MNIQDSERYRRVVEAILTRVSEDPYLCTCGARLFRYHDEAVCSVCGKRWVYVDLESCSNVSSN
jgi:hypothetical protein